MKSPTLALLAGIGIALSGCAATPPAGGPNLIAIPVLAGWYDNETVLYITTEVSDAAVARDKGATHTPRLAEALPAGPRQPGQRSSVDKVYAITNFKQASVFASAPSPVGPASTDTAYSPLWQMVKVTWLPGHAPQPLKSQEQVLAAAERGQVRLDETRVVLNCPIVQRGSAVLPGMQPQALPR
jgi:hypothetical protein